MPLKIMVLKGLYWIEKQKLCIVIRNGNVILFCQSNYANQKIIIGLKMA